MARFPVGKRIPTSEPTITVDAGLAPGTHRFQLEVVTSDGRTSKPDVVVVEVTGIILRDPLRPDPIVRPGRPVVPTRPSRPDPE